jgi:hypothetical protein
LIGRITTNGTVTNYDSAVTYPTHATVTTPASSTETGNTATVTTMPATTRPGVSTAEGAINVTMGKPSEFHVTLSTSAIERGAVTST